MADRPSSSPDSNVLQFLRAVKREWVLLVGGGCGIVVVLTVAEHLSGQNIPWPWYVCLLALLFGIACYRAWANERDTGHAIQLRLIAEKEAATNPDIHVEIMEVHPEWNVSMVGEHPYYLDEYFTVRAHLTNRGRPVAVRRYELHVNFEKGIKHTELSTLEHLALERKQRQTVKLGYRASEVATVQEKIDDLSHRKAPIGLGENAEGWLRFVLPEISPDESKQITGITLWAVDADNKAHKASAKKEQWRQSGELVNTYRQEFERELARAVEEEKAESQVKREYKIERLKELIKESDPISSRWVPLTREYAGRLSSLAEHAESFLTSYYDEATAERYKQEGASVLHALLKELLDE